MNAAAVNREKYRSRLDKWRLSRAKEAGMPVDTLLLAERWIREGRAEWARNLIEVAREKARA